MPFLVKEHEALDPVHVRFFGAMAVVFGANRRSHPIKEFGFVRGHEFQLLSFCTRRSVSAVVVDYLRRRGAWRCV